MYTATTKHQCEAGGLMMRPAEPFHNFATNTEQRGAATSPDHMTLDLKKQSFCIIQKDLSYPSEWGELTNNHSPALSRSNQKDYRPVLLISQKVVVHAVHK